MVSFKQILVACVMAPALMIKTADASFGYCAFANDFDLTNTYYGFKLWNDRGDYASGLTRSAYNNGADVSNNGWTFGIGSFSDGYIASVTVRNPTYNLNTLVPIERVCSYGSGRKSSVYYGCYDNGGTFCQSQGPNIRNLCNRYSTACPPLNKKVLTKTKNRLVKHE